MINFFKNKKGFTIAGISLLLLVIAVYASEPGSEDDPLITVSYFNKQIELFKESVETSLVDIKKEFSELPSGDASFKLVNLKADSSLICGEGTELIVRSGECTAIASQSGGLSDVTVGRDIPHGEVIESNHHLIVPRNDGRGITAVVGGAVMVRGKYEIVTK